MNAFWEVRTWLSILKYPETKYLPTRTTSSIRLSLPPASERQPTWPGDNYTATLTGVPYTIPGVDEPEVLTYSQQQARIVLRCLFTLFCAIGAAFIAQCFKRGAREYDKHLVASNNLEDRQQRKTASRAIRDGKKIFTGQGTLSWQRFGNFSKPSEPEQIHLADRIGQGSFGRGKSSLGGSLFKSASARNSARSRRPTLESVFNPIVQLEGYYAPKCRPRHPEPATPASSVLNLTSRMWRSVAHTVDVALQLYLYVATAREGWYAFGCAIVGTFLGHWLCNGDFQEWILWQCRLRRAVEGHEQMNGVESGAVFEESGEEDQVQRDGREERGGSQMTQGDVMRRHWSNGVSDLIY